MNFKRWQVIFGAQLLILSALLYVLHYVIFHDGYHIFYYLLSDLAFLPAEVLIVTLIIHALLEHREKQAKMHKLNMVIGAFFSEVGTVLLKDFAALDGDSVKFHSQFAISEHWTSKDFAQLKTHVQSHHYTIDCSCETFGDMREFLISKRQFLLRLLENPNLLEHETFTDLLWAVFHLTEELASRESTSNLPETDCLHLKGDIKRSYRYLLIEWVAYMQHLKNSYPYLFSLAIRTNPLNPEASVVIMSAK